MAEASCSGGTPFKRFVDQQNRDVSHHQDRLFHNAFSPAQNSFRSSPANQSAQAQNDFGAFMNGSSSQFGGAALQHPHHATGILPGHPQAFESRWHPSAPLSQVEMAQQPRSADMSNWAADFTRFSGQQQAPAHPMAVNGAAQPLAHMQSHHQAPALSFQSAFQFPNAGFSPLYGPTNGGMMDPNAAAAQRPAAEADFDQEMTRWMEANGPASNAKAMEDVDAIMEQMARELDMNDGAFKDGEAAAPLHQDPRFTDLETPEIRNLTPDTLSQTINNEPQVEQVKPRSEISEAAEKLLDTVQNEQGEKWKNSVFLSLMRDFRDGKKDIVDNEVQVMPYPSAEETEGGLCHPH
ncbi:unnamed protein product [Clonostachys rhizophaga]|uniref:Peroxin 20 n=1 Tax=Clonostachys rhizophaga TaxID=160324 RepID=A0A9N9YPV2_9HYPO|nr:unnamed protein product [Clonostachys rhizophaga]